MSKKRKTIFIAIVSNSFLVCGKLIVGIYIGLISVIAEAAHSGLDLIAAIIAYYFIRKAEEPPDERHQFGHGKFEDISRVIEALLIIIVAVLIMAEAIPVLLAGGKRVQSLGLGIIVMGISALVNLFVSNMLLNVGRETDSPALLADGWHLRTDVYTSASVFVGIVIIKLTNLTILDPLIALAVTILILKIAFQLINDSLKVLLDEKLSDEDERMIKSILQKYNRNYIEIHQLRTRKAGSQRHIDFHLVVPSNKSVEEAHMLCSSIKKELEENLEGADVLIHIEPCNLNYEERV